MGSGDKFRIELIDSGIAYGFSITPNSEHKLSIRINIILISIYIGIGKGYDER